MDDLTFKTGIDLQGRKIHGGGPLPSQGERHENRHIRAASTITSKGEPLDVIGLGYPDGRIAYPEVVRYQLRRWDVAARAYVDAELVDLPPTAETHPDPHAEEMARKAGKGFLPTTLPYRAVVRNLSAYDRLGQSGLLDIGHRLPPAAVPEVVDNRVAPGA